MPDTTATHQFRAETRKVLNILTHSLYTNREIFLRELISNASDALDKLRFLQGKGEAVRDPDLPLEIAITVDKTQRLLIIRDTGVGMSREEMAENLGTIAHSGSEAFLRDLAEAAGTADNKDTAGSIIGRFGIGFYSVFMAADKVEVISRPAVGDAPASLWTSDGGRRAGGRRRHARHAHPCFPEGRRDGVSGKIPAGRHHPHPLQLHLLPHSAGRRARQHHSRPVARAEIFHQQGTIRGFLQVSDL